MGCIVVFMHTACTVKYNGKIILTGYKYKDPSKDLWVLPITPDAIARQEKLGISQGNDSVSPRANKILLRQHVEHTIAPACATLAQEQLSTCAARDGLTTAVSSQP